MLSISSAVVDNENNVVVMKWLRQIVHFHSMANKYAV
jgi:hypothetical protein